MKILQINSVCGAGSTGKIASDLADILHQNGDECLICYGRGDSQVENSFKINSKLDVRLHGALSRLTDRQGFYSSSATRRLIRKIVDYNPDVVHLHNIHGYYLNIKILLEFLANTGKPVLLTLHDCWTFTGHCAYFDFVNCQKWRTECRKCPQKQRYPASFLLDNSRKNYRQKKELFGKLQNLTIITPSEWLAGLVRESFLACHEVKVIPNGINLDVFQPRESNFRQEHRLENDTLILGVASVWEERKGLKDFVELAKILPEGNRIVLVGLSDKQVHELPPEIIGLARTSSAIELAEIYSAVDVFFNPTYEDNFPTVNLEALSCGTPVVTYATGGSPESLTPDCGWIIPQGDLPTAFQTLASYKKSPAISTACTARAANYNKTQKFLEYIKLYELVVKFIKRRR